MIVSAFVGGCLFAVGVVWLVGWIYKHDDDVSEIEFIPSSTSHITKSTSGTQGKALLIRPNYAQEQISAGEEDLNTILKP